MTDNTSMVQYEAEFLAPVVTVELALRAYQTKLELCEKILRKDVDYGVIPGTSAKPSLFKAGAEKAASFFGLHAVMEDEKVVEDWTGAEHNGEPFFYYRRRCNLYRGNVLVGGLSGSANSWEKKYRYRWVEESQVPITVDKTTLKTQGGKVTELAFAIEKAEESGKYGKPAAYWKRFKDAIANNAAVKGVREKKGGGFMDTWTIDGMLYQLPNEDPADSVNTILKMADKRALVATVLVVTGLSEHYTQDIEDYIIDGSVVEIGAGAGAATTTTNAAPAKMTFDEAGDVLTPGGAKFSTLSLEKLKIIQRSTAPNLTPKMHEAAEIRLTNPISAPSDIIPPAEEVKKAQDKVETSTEPTTTAYPQEPAEPEIPQL